MKHLTSLVSTKVGRKTDILEIINDWKIIILRVNSVFEKISVSNPTLT
jgi:hypothetical protein